MPKSKILTSLQIRIAEAEKNLASLTKLVEAKQSQLESTIATIHDKEKELTNRESKLQVELQQVTEKHRQESIVESEKLKGANVELAKEHERLISENNEIKSEGLAYAEQREGIISDIAHIRDTFEKEKSTHNDELDRLRQSIVDKNLILEQKLDDVQKTTREKEAIEQDIERKTNERDVLTDQLNSRILELKRQVRQWEATEQQYEASIKSTREADVKRTENLRAGELSLQAKKRAFMADCQEFETEKRHFYATRDLY